MHSYPFFFFANPYRNSNGRASRSHWLTRKRNQRRLLNGGPWYRCRSNGKKVGITVTLFPTKAAAHIARRRAITIYAVASPHCPITGQYRSFRTQGEIDVCLAISLRRCMQDHIHHNLCAFIPTVDDGGSLGPASNALPKQIIDAAWQPL
jgi:hypothetical protein